MPTCKKCGIVTVKQCKEVHTDRKIEKPKELALGRTEVKLEGAIKKWKKQLSRT